MRRRGLSKAEIHQVRAAYQVLFFGAGEFKTRLEQVAHDFAAHPLVARIVAFIHAGKRPLTMGIKRAEADIGA
jgi:UDP-N-acetylglucosamine acyltransferase